MYNTKEDLLNKSTPSVVAWNTEDEATIASSDWSAEFNSINLETCTHCGGSGSTKEDPNYCKVCKRYARDIKPIPNFTYSGTDFYISERFRHSWVENDFKTLVKNLNYSKKEQEYLLDHISTMKDLLDNFSDIRRNTNLYFIHFPRQLDTDTFIYNLLLYYRYYKYSLNPITVLSEIDLTNPMFKNVEVLPLRILSTVTPESLQTLDELLDYRYYKNKVTIIYSAMSLQELNSITKLGDNIVNPDFTVDFIHKI